MRTDRFGNQMGDGRCHADYSVREFPGTDIQSRVAFSETTETVYVTYSSAKTAKSVTCRFSWHMNNAVEFGDQLDGNIATDDEILFRLGYKTRAFVPDTRLMIMTQQVAKKRLQDYEEAALTIQEMYALGADADLSAFRGKLAKGSNYLILGDRVECHKVTRVDRLGRTLVMGEFIYSDIEK